MAGSLRSDKRALNSRWEDVDSDDGTTESLRKTETTEGYLVLVAV
jgi:hypothetical protein